MEGIFLHLLNISMMASGIVLVVLVLRLLLHKAPRWCICLLWAVVALRLACPLTVESVVGLMPSGFTLAQTITEQEQDVFPSPAPTENVPSVNKPSSVEGQAPALTPTAPMLQAEHSPAWLLTYIFSRVWPVGVLVMLAYTLGSYVRLRMRLRTATRLDGNVYQGECVSSPFILGIVHPRIYLPYDLPIEQQAYVLAHERVHLRRGDHIVKLFAMLLLAVYWYNPLLWLAYGVFCRDLELACDERVIRDYAPEERQAYSAALLANSTARRLTLCPLAFGEVGVKQRIKSVMNYKKPAFWIVIVAVLAIITTAVCLLTSPPDKDTTPPTSDAEESTFTAVVLTVYDKSVLVAPDEESWEYSTADRISLSLPENSPKLVAGDTIEVVHGGYILSTYPAMINEVQSMRKIKDAPELTYPLTVTFSLEKELVQQQSKTDYPIYYYGLDSVQVPCYNFSSEPVKMVDLASALGNGYLSLDALLEDARTCKEGVQYGAYDDGGSEFFCFSHYTILKMNTLDGDRSLYIGPRDMDISIVDSSGEDKPAYTAVTVVVKEIISDTMVLAVAPNDTSEQYHVSLAKLVGKKPQVGDTLEVIYDGMIQETYPAQFSDVQSIKVVHSDSTTTTTTTSSATVKYPLTIEKSHTVTLTNKTKETNGLARCDVYYYNLTRAEVTTNGKKQDLATAIGNGTLTVEDFLADANAATSVLKDIYKDGGSMLYKFGDYTILKMNRLDGDRTLFIGTSDMTYSVRDLRDSTQKKELLKVAFSSNDEKVLVSDETIAAVTPYKIYYTGIKSVKVLIDNTYVDLLTALENKQVDMNTLLSDLTALAREENNQVVFGDGVDENGKPVTSQGRRFSTYEVYSVYSESKKEVEFISRQ